MVAVAGVVWLTSAVLVGCDSSERGQVGVGPSGAKAEVGPVPAYPQRPGDPRKGYDVLLNRSAVTCGLPYSAYVRALERAGRQLGRGLGPQFPGRTGRNTVLPYSLTSHRSAAGVDLVTTNCLACHAAAIDGQLIMGLGNALLDMTQDPLVEVEAARTYVNGSAELAEWRRWADRIAILSDFMVTDTVGVNSARTMTQALMAHRDPKTLAWSTKPLLKPPSGPPVPVAVPPWWNLGKKHALFYTGEGRGDHVRFMMHPALTCTDSLVEVKAMDAWMVDVRAYLAALKPPKYPYAIDRALAERGHSVFQSNCKECHGSYGEDWRYPNLVVALGKVGTDPELARDAFGAADRFRAWFGDSFFGELSQDAPALGYVAPPLDGIWATAPYLHNDSVPTLADLLNSPDRPDYWRFSRTATDAPIFDRARVGWDYQSLPAGKAAAMSWNERNRIYDSTGKGYGNTGHTYGDDLSPEVRRALIEYLKTL
jgi:mono/diheme cytochrome c family protein